MEWQQPHWSGRPQASGAPQQKLRPNGFARMARFSAENRLVVLALYILVTVLCGGFAAATLEIDPDEGPRITLDAATAASQAELERQFPGIDRTFLAIVESGDADTSRAQAVALAASLARRNEFFASAFVPGTGPFYDGNALLFHSLEDVAARVDGVLRMQPLYQAVAAAPDIPGLSALVTEIGKAVELGRSPPGLEILLVAASEAIEGEVRGTPRPIRWPELAGLSGETQSLRWFVIATPQEGVEREAAAFARQSADRMQGVSWLWPRRALGSTANPWRDLIVPAGLSIFVTLTLLGAGLGSFRQTIAIAVSAAVTLALSSAVAASMGRPLDGATWSFAAAVLAPVIVSGVVLCLGYAQARARGVSVLRAIMLAAQRRGGQVSAITFLFAAFWLSWLLRQLPSLSQFAVIALIGTAVAWLAAFTLLPAVLALLDRGKSPAEPHWLDEALVGQRSHHLHNALDIVAMIVLAGAIFSAAFLPAVRFGERQLPSRPGPFLDTPDARGAIHVLARPEAVAPLVGEISKLSEVGAIRTIAQFLPADAGRKAAELRRLESFTPFSPAPRQPAEEYVVRTSFAELDRQLSAIAINPSASPALRGAASRLRSAVDLFVTPEPPTPARVKALEIALFSGLGELSRSAERLSRLQEPRIEALDPQLLRRFVSPEGLWRIEVMPRTDTGILSFAAALRRAVPGAAGEPLPALARNEIIHHETLLALAGAFAAAAVLVMAVLRSLTGWLVSLTPVAAFVTLTAASAVVLDIGLNAAILAGASAVAAVLIASAMTMAEPRTGGVAGGAGRDPSAIRAALLPPLALAGAVAPLAISSRPAVAELGALMSLLFLMAAALCIVLVPALSRWLRALKR